MKYLILLLTLCFGCKENKQTETVYPVAGQSHGIDFGDTLIITTSGQVGGSEGLGTSGSASNMELKGGRVIRLHEMRADEIPVPNTSIWDTTGVLYDTCIPNYNYATFVIGEHAITERPIGIHPFIHKDSIKRPRFIMSGNSGTTTSGSPANWLIVGGSTAKIDSTILYWY